MNRPGSVGVEMLTPLLSLNQSPSADNRIIAHVLPIQWRGVGRGPGEHRLDGERRRPSLGVPLCARERSELPDRRQPTRRCATGNRHCSIGKTAHDELKAFERQLEQTDGRYEVGLVAITDVKEAQASFDSAQASVLVAENQLATALQALKVTTGDFPESFATLRDNIELKQPQPANVAEQQLELTQREVERDIRNSYADVASAISRVNALARALESSTTGLEATQAGFDAGTRTNVDVLNAIRSESNAKAQLAGARYDYMLALLELHALVGELGEAEISEINDWLIR